MIVNVIVLGVLFLLAAVLLVLIVRANLDYWKQKMNSNNRYKTSLGSEFNIFDDEY